MRDERKQLAGDTVNLNLDGPLKFRRVALKTLAQSPV